MAGKIPRAFIDDLIARIDLVDVIDARVPLRKVGINYLARCPFHNEKTPSFNVNRDKQFYHCFGCGAHGNAIGFLMEYERQTFVEAVETLADSLGLTIPWEFEGADRRHEESELLPLFEVQQLAAAFYARQLREPPEAERPREYLQRRGLNEEIIRRFQLGYAPPGWRNLPDALPRQHLLAAGLMIAREGGIHYDRFRDRIMFPIRDRRGRVVGFGGRVLGDETPKYLNSPETPVFKKHREVYGLYELLEARQKPARIVVVEGYMDVIALAQHGLSYAVATLGTATSAEHAKLLFRYTRELVFCFDGDSAGRNAAWKALEASLPALREDRSIRFLMLPDTHDPDSLVRLEGRDRFEQRVSEAQPLSEYFFEHLSGDLDLRIAEGRTAMVARATPLLDKLQQGIFRDMMQARLKDLTGYDKASKGPGKPGASSLWQRPSSFSQERTPHSPLRTILTLLVQNPAFFALIDAKTRFALEASEKAGPLATKLFAILEEKPDISSGGLEERFRGEPEYVTVVKLNVREKLLTEEQEQEEFRHALKKFNVQRMEQRLEHLVKKAESTPLNLTEREEMRRLLREK